VPPGHGSLEGPILPGMVGVNSRGRDARMRSFHRNVASPPKPIPDPERGNHDGVQGSGRAWKARSREEDGPRASIENTYA
jgi:hypothetical protein